MPDRGDLTRPQVRPGVAAAVIDVFVYVVVLNLFVQYVPRVLSETFTLSLLTAVLLKSVLEVVLWAKSRARERFRRATSAVQSVGAALLLWAVLVGSKFVVLEAVDLVFGPRVSLGGYLSVTLLVLALLASRAAVRRILWAEDATDLSGDLDPGPRPAKHASRR